MGTANIDYEQRCIHSPMMDESNPIILGLFIKDLTIQ